MPSPSPTPRIPSTLRAACMGALVAGCVPLLWRFRSVSPSDIQCEADRILAMLLLWRLRFAFPSDRVQVLFILVIALGGLYLLWRSYGSHRSFMLAASTLLLGPFIFLLARSDLDVTLIDHPCPDWFDDWHELRESPRMEAFFLLTFVLAGAAGAVIARWLVHQERRWVMRVIRAASLTALACAGALVAGFLPRALRFPAPAHYVESLPTLGVVPGPEGVPSRTVVVTLPRRTASSGFRSSSSASSSSYYRRQFAEVDVAIRVYESILGDFAVRRFCPVPSDVMRYDAKMKSELSGETVWLDYGGCWVHLSVAAEPFDEGAHMVGHLRERQWPDSRDSHHCQDPLFDEDSAIPLFLREDAAHALVVFDGEIRRAIRRVPLELTEVKLRDVADTTSPPRGWIAASAAGVLVAGWLQLRRRRALRRLGDRLARARAGVLDSDGWIVFGDSAPALHIGADTPLAPGPVLVVDPGGAPDKHSSPYRGQDPARHADILPGDRSEILARERMAWMPRDAQALAIVLLTAAPLAAAVHFWLM